MKKRNIGLCVVATTLFMGSHAQATELVLAKDHTNVVNQAAEIAAYKSNRPPVNQRLFKSKAVEAEIIRVKKLLTNQKLAWMFENCFPNTRNNRSLPHNRWQARHFCLHRRYSCHVAA